MSLSILNLNLSKVVCTCLTLFLIYEELITFFNIRPTSVSTGRTALDTNTFPEERIQYNFNFSVVQKILKLSSPWTKQLTNRRSYVEAIEKV